jgi:hypothetical protein
MVDEPLSRHGAHMGGNGFRGTGVNHMGQPPDIAQSGLNTREVTNVD